MCGIGAIIGGDKSKIEEMMLQIRFRGSPENFMEHSALENAVLACNRLAIVDEENGKQPMSHSSIHVVANCEVYNYNELRDELIALGHVFKTNSDTEIIPHAYMEWGSEFVARLDGQFAIFVYDEFTDNYLLARDPFGIKPIFYGEDNGSFYVASEAKQLVNICNNIHELSPGHFIENGSSKNYFELDRGSKHDDTLFKLLEDAVRKRVQTELPIAVYLSGGIDSTAILALARSHHDDVTAIIMGDDEGTLASDATFAIRYCKEKNIPYKQIPKPTEEELFALVPEIVRITESFEPNVIKQSSLSYYMAKTAKELGYKIVLCGEGADEILCGYPEFTGAADLTLLSKQFLNDLHLTQLRRVDRSNMAYTVEVRVPFLDEHFVSYALGLQDNAKYNKKALRNEMISILPTYICERQKVVLSEGIVGKGNSLEDGLFTKMAESKVTDTELSHYQRKYPQYNLRTREEAYYFRLYLGFGYDKIVVPRRPIANSIRSVK